MKKILIIAEIIVFVLVVVLIVYSLMHRSILDKYENRKNFADVKKTLQENLDLIKKNPQHDGAYYSLGQGLYSLKGYDDAIEALLAATKISPTNDSYFAFLGKAYQERKDYSNARDAYIKALELNPNKAFHYTTLAWLYYFRLDTEKDKAYEVLKRGLEKFPTDKDILFDIARYYVYDNNRTEFLKYAPRYLKIDPNHELIKSRYEEWRK